MHSWSLSRVLLLQRQLLQQQHDRLQEHQSREEGMIQRLHTLEQILALRNTRDHQHEEDRALHARMADQLSAAYERVAEAERQVHSGHALSANETVSALQAELSRVHASVATQQQDLQLERAQMASLRQEIQQQRSSQVQAFTDLQAELQRQSKLAVDFATVQQQLNHMQEARDTAKSALLASQSQCQQLQDDNLTLRDQLQRQERAMHQLHEVAREREKSNQQQLIAALEQTHQAQLSTLRAELNSLKESLQSANGRADSIEKQSQQTLKELQETIQSQAAELHLLRLDVKHIKDNEDPSMHSLSPRDVDSAETAQLAVARPKIVGTLSRDHSFYERAVSDLNLAASATNDDQPELAEPKLNPTCSACKTMRRTVRLLTRQVRVLQEQNSLLHSTLMQQQDQRVLQSQILSLTPVVAVGIGFEDIVGTIADTDIQFDTESDANLLE